MSSFGRTVAVSGSVRFAFLVLLSSLVGASGCSVLVRGELPDDQKRDGGGMDGAVDGGGDARADGGVDGGDGDGDADAAGDGSVVTSCTGVDDGTPCGIAGEGLICIGGRCMTSRCGDGFTDLSLDEVCDDGQNGEPNDGCTDDCLHSCEEGIECDNALPCDGAESCSDHVCVPGAPADGDPCDLEGDAEGVCRSGSCVSPGCGNEFVEGDEECDDGANGDQDDGCRDDCTHTCDEDAECDDLEPCNGDEACDFDSKLCIPGDTLDCDDSDRCTNDCCEPFTGCKNEFVDGDGDGFAEGTCGPGTPGGDCNDGDRSVFPGAAEFCDGIDNDCDESTDEDSMMAQCYPDEDGDGYGVEASGMLACTCPAGTVPPRADCLFDCFDDPLGGGASVFPGQTLFFTTGYGRDDSYDYDCDGREDAQYTIAGITACGGILSRCAFDGWEASRPPTCGDRGTFRDCTDTGLSCSERTSLRTQACH